MKRSKTGNVDTFCLLKAIFERNFSDNQIRYVMVRFVLELSGYIYQKNNQKVYTKCMGGLGFPFHTKTSETICPIITVSFEANFSPLTWNGMILTDLAVVTNFLLTGPNKVGLAS